MNRNLSIAVIVPAYNAAKTVERTIDSLLAQTWKNIQVFVVDDGSKDATTDVVAGMAKKDSRIVLLRQENAGPYSARVNALSRLETDYFGFVDADDTVEPEMYESMICFAEENDLDVVKCDICGWREGDREEIYRSREEIYRNFILPQLYEGRGNALITDKIYRLRCRPESFEEIHSLAFEDVLMNMQIFPHVRSFGHLPREFYHYIRNAQSTTNTYRERDAGDFIEVVRCRRRFCGPLGLDPEGRTFYEWTVLNAGNVLYRAAYAKKVPIIQRYRNIVGLANLDEVLKAVEKTGGGEGPRRRRFQLQFAGKFTVAYLVWTRLMAAMYAVYAFARRKFGK